MSKFIFFENTMLNVEDIGTSEILYDFRTEKHILVIGDRRNKNDELRRFSYENKVAAQKELMNLYLMIKD